ncbi:MAG TPA: ribosome assembly factor SBDS [Candidatus Woesearchaeota archaeon]|mgnify:CR=1 FL=1|nr:ribosome assembly factor SBDS [Candidatus Woesearchaeota archaeon]
MVFIPEKESISFNVTKIKKAGNNFEVVIEPELAVKLREGQDVDLIDAAKSMHVFTDANKGLLAADKDIMEAFGTIEPEKVIKKIIKEGEVHLTAKIRDELRQRKLRRLIDIIHMNSVDPKTKLPHPVSRIEAAIEEAKLHVDEFKPVEEQIEGFVSKLKLILPLSFEKKRLEVTIPAVYSAKGYGYVKQHAPFLFEQWNNDGSFSCKLEVPAGHVEEIMDVLNNMTKGEVEIKILDK